MNEEEALRIAREIAAQHNLAVEFLSDDEKVRTVGVQGDNRTYARPVALTGEFPGWEVIAKVSSEISSRTPINRVTWEVARRRE